MLHPRVSHVWLQVGLLLFLAACLWLGFRQMRTEKVTRHTAGSRDRRKPVAKASEASNSYMGPRIRSI